MLPRLRDERGFTLAELLVTMSLLSVVMTLVVGSTIFLQRTINQTDQRFDDLAQARIGMDASTKWLRGAIRVDPYTNPFIEARANQVEFLANVDVATNAAPKQVRLHVNNGALEERVYNGTINAAGDWQQSGAPRTRILARGVVNPDTVFRFFHEDGTELTNGTTALSESTRADIRRVGISLNVQQAPNVQANVSQLSNRVWLPNQYYFDSEEEL